MGTLLRSGKFVRYLTGLSNNPVFNTHRGTFGNVFKHSHALCTTVAQGFASTAQRTNQNLDQLIQQLDQEVRRAKRISRSSIEEAFAEIRRCKTASSSQCLTVIQCCGNFVPEELPESRTALVQEIWRTLHSLNVPMDISHYNALLRVYLENGHSFSPTEFLADLKSKDVVPNRVTFQRLISRYCQVGDIDGAKTILAFMHDKQIPVNEPIFNALIEGHSEANDINSAVGILSSMKQSGLEPTPDTYTVLMCAYAKHGKIDEIMNTLENCETSDINLQDRGLLDIIYQLTTNGHSESVDKIIPKLKKSAGYNQHAVNVILRLVNKGHEDIAFEILKTMPRGRTPDGGLSETGGFFIKHLVKSGRPTEKILSICKELQDKGLNRRATLIALETRLETATTSGMVDETVQMLKELQQNDLPLQQRYFWPLMRTQADSGPDAVLDVLRLMVTEFNVKPSGETIRDYVVPNLNLQERSYEKVFLMLRAAGVTTSNAATSCVYDALKQYRIKEAATLASTYTIYYQPGVFRQPLIKALVKTSDYDSYISILRSLYENLPRLQLLRNARAADEPFDDEAAEDSQTQADILGRFVVDAVIQLHNNRAAIEKVLLGLVAEGLTMSKVHADRVQERLGSLLTPEISTMLDQLTSGELEPVPYESRSMRTDFADLPSKHLEKMIHQKEASGENVKGLYRSLLLAYVKENNLQKAEEFFERLESSDFVVPVHLYALLIELYCRNSSLDKALAVLAKVKAKEPDFVLDDFKTIRIVREFVVSDQINEAVEFLNSVKRAEKSQDEPTLGYNSLCWGILNQLADKGKDADLTKLFNALEENNFIEVSNGMLGPLVKVHLVNDDVAKAMQTFEAICAKYNCTPLKNELTCKLIQLEDVLNLQLVTDLSTNIHGEVNSLLDLVIAFSECGRIRQARKILETPGLRSRPQKINEACERYRRLGQAAPMETLLQATRGLHYIDRNAIFFNLLLTYRKEGSAEKALELWTTVQEDEDVTLSDEFLTILADLLKEKGMKVPFVVPISQTPKVAAARKSNVDSGKIKKPPKDDAIRTNVKSNVENSLRTETQILEELVRQGRLDAATEHVTKMIEANTYPHKMAFRFYLNKIAQTGNYETLEQLSSKLTPDVKRLVSFDNRLCNAYQSAGKVEVYIDRMVTSFNDATTKEELPELEAKLPRGALSGILTDQPELSAKLEKFAYDVAAKGIYSPLNIIWMNHIENGKLESAARMMKDYLVNSSQIMFDHALKTARERKDESIVQNLLAALKGTRVSERGVGTVHSCLIDVYCSLDKYDDALKAIDNAIKDVRLENINKTALERVKNGLEAAGKKFPHEIPSRSTVDKSSSSRFHQ